MKHIYLTKSGLAKLKKELDELKAKRPILVKSLEEARQQGDLRENAEYHATKEALTKLQNRINELEEKISRVRVIEKTSSDRVLLGSTVYVRNLNSQTDFKYQIVDAEEANVEEGKISVNSPVAAGLFEHKVGDVVEIAVPAGILKLKILKIE